jgi:HEAT repeat protein
VPDLKVAPVFEAAVDQPGTAKTQRELSVEELLELAAPHSDLFTRSDALQDLEPFAGDPKVRKNLLAWLSKGGLHSNTIVRILRSQSHMPEVQERLLRIVTDTKEARGSLRESTRVAALNVIGKHIDVPKVREAVLASLKSPEPGVRLEAAYALRNLINEREVRDALVAHLQDPDTGFEKTYLVWEDPIPEKFVRRFAALAAHPTVQQGLFRFLGEHPEIIVPAIIAPFI